jgi:hypothetical protein
MYRTELNPMIEQCLTEIMESMFFMGVMGPMDAPPPTAGFLAMKLEFTGPSRGSLGLRVPVATAQNIAANFLGEEAAEIDDQRALEVVGELSNMVLGSFLSTYASKDVFDLTHPERDESALEPESWTVSRHMELEEGSVFIWLVLREQIAEQAA